MVLLVKPQFEAGRSEVSKGKGVITDPEVHARVRDEVGEALVASGCTVVGWTESPLKGADGNVEFLVHVGSASRGGDVSVDRNRRSSPITNATRSGPRRRGARVVRDQGSGRVGRPARCGGDRPAGACRSSADRRGRPRAQPRRRRHDAAQRAAARRCGGAVARREPRCPRIPDRGRVRRHGERARTIRRRCGSTASGSSTSG